MEERGRDFGSESDLSLAGYETLAAAIDEE